MLLSQILNAMVQLEGELVKNQNLELDKDYLVLASIDSSSDDDGQCDENDVFNTSCHGSHFKRMKEEPTQCDEYAIKRRKLHTQLDLMNSILMSMSFGGNVTSSDELFSDGSASCSKRTVSRKLPTKRLAARKTKSNNHCRKKRSYTFSRLRYEHSKRRYQAKELREVGEFIDSEKHK